MWRTRQGEVGAMRAAYGPGASPHVIFGSKSFPKKPMGLKMGQKYTTINQIALSLTGGIGVDAQQAFYAFKAAKTRGLCHVLALMVIFL
jgi:hypothetical protein